MKEMSLSRYAGQLVAPAAGGGVLNPWLLVKCAVSEQGPSWVFPQASCGGLSAEAGPAQDSKTAADAAVATEMTRTNLRVRDWTDLRVIMAMAPPSGRGVRPSCIPDRLDNIISGRRPRV